MNANTNLCHVDAESTSEPVIVMTRVFDARREKVWEAFTTPEHVKRWYGGHGFSNPLCEMDVRPGGHWRHIMRTPDGSEYPLDLVFIEVIKPERLVWQDSNFGKSTASGKPTSRMEITFEDLGAQTRWTMVATFPSLAARDLTRQMGFARVVSEGAEKLNDLVKAL
jgi:uncharacterized protein YndB with AHSA1/START domain